MTRIVLDGGADAPIDSGRRLALVQALLGNGHPVTLAGADGTVAPVDGDDLLVLSDQDPSADRDAESTEGGLEVRYRGVAGLEADAVVELVARERRESDAPAPGSWKPWFPVIDYERCTNCMQCLSFCLFGVYDVDEDKKIEVHEPEKCKTNCPACSRVCPEVAILFPKYKNGPINGDVVQAEDVQREKMKTDISSLLGGDIYSMLRERHKRAESRFSKERDESRALKERQRCLKKLQAELDIPEELLNELPSAEEIQARFAERASRKTG